MKKKLHFLSALLVAMLLIPWQLSAQVLSENFNDRTEGLPENWTTEGNAGWYNWKSTGYDYDGISGEGVYFNSYSADNGATAVLKTPVFSLKDVTKTQFLRFAARLTDDGDKASYKVCISTDGGATYTTVLQEITYDKHYNWTEFEISLADYAGKENLCIVFNCVGGWYGRHFLDNVEVAPAPAVAKAKDLAVTSINQLGATLTWKVVADIPAATSYEVQVIKVGAKVAADTLSYDLSTAGDITLANGVYSYLLEDALEPGTQYYFTVKGIIGEDQAEVISGPKFFTLCDVYAIDDAGLSLDLSKFEINPFSPCWTTNGEFTFYSSDKEYNNLSLGWSSSDNYLYLISPAIDHATNDIEIELKYSSYYESGFYYGIASSTDLKDMDTIGHFNIEDESGIFVFNTAKSTFGTATEKVVAIIFDNDEPSIHSIAIRQKPCCLKPLNVVATPIDSVSLQVSWSGVATSFNVIVTDTVAKTEKISNFTGNVGTIAGLNLSTTYAIEVVAVCDGCGEGGVVGYSDTTDVVYATTFCGVADEVYFTEDFTAAYNATTYESVALPECWIQNKEGVWAYNQSGEEKFAYLRGGYIKEGEKANLVTHPFVITEAKKGSYDVAFEMERYDLTNTAGIGELTVWANSRPDTIGATKIATIERSYKDAPIECAAGWYAYSFNIPASVVGTTYIIFEGESNGTNNKSIYLDNVQVLDKPTCRPVSEIQIGVPTTTTLPLSWTAVEGQTSWVLSYVVKNNAGDTVANVKDFAITANPYTIANLPSSSELTIIGSITSDCGEVNSAAKEFQYKFQTECASFALPLFESFENSGKFPPICWTSENTEGSSDYKWEKDFGDSDYEIADDEAYAYLGSSSSASKAILATPELVFEANKDYRIEFYVFRYNYASSSYENCGVNVYLNDSPTNTDDAEYLTYVPYCTGHSFVAEDYGAWFDQPALTDASDDMYRVRLDFNTSELTGKYVIFEGITKGSYASLVIDAISIGLKPEVDMVDNFKVDSISATTARVSFTEKSVTSFDVVYGVPGFDPTTDTTNIVTKIEGRSYKLEGLADDTEYEVYLRGRNGEKVSEWSKSPVKFRTLCLPFTFDGETVLLEGFEDYTSTNFGCWYQTGKYGYVFGVKDSYEYYNGSEYVTATPKEGDQMAFLGYTYGSWMYREVNLKASENYSISAWARDCYGYTPEYVLSLGYSKEASSDKVTKLVTKTITKLGDWEQVVAYFTVPEDGVYYVAIGAESAYNVLLDSVVVKTEAVIPPTIKFTALYDTSVSFDIESNASAWDFYYSATEFIPDSVAAEDLIALSEKSYTIDSLDAYTTYYYALRAKDGENISVWTDLQSFTTACAPKALPYADSFEEGFGCWTINATEGEYSLNTSYKYASEGNNSLYLYEVGGKVIAPRFDGNLYDYRASIKIRNKWGSAAYTTTIVAGVMTDIFDDSSFVAVADTFRLSTTDGFVDYLFDFKSIVGTKYEDAKYVVFNIVNPEAGSYLDEFELIKLPEVPEFSTEHRNFTSESFVLELSVPETETRGSRILYKLDDAADWTVYEKGLVINKTTKVSAVSVLYDAENDSVLVDAAGDTIFSREAVATFTKQAIPDAPEFSYESGYFASEKLTLEAYVAETETRDAYILYKVNNAPEWSLYQGGILLEAIAKVEAVVVLYDENTGDIMVDVDGNTIMSEVTEAIYTQVLVAAPEFSYESGYFVEDNMPLEITSAPNTQVLVTIDGSEPKFEEVQTGKTIPYNGGMPVMNATIKARAYMTEMAEDELGMTSMVFMKDVAGNYIYSEVAEVTYTKVAAPAAPVFTPAAGEYPEFVEVSIACATENAVVKYELGRTATAESATYAEPIRLSETEYVSAVAYLVDAQGAYVKTINNKLVASDVVRAEYTIFNYVAPMAPTFTPEAGEYVDSVVVELACATEGAAILYDVTGAEPTIASARYAEPIVITETTTISAIAVLVDAEGEVILSSQELPYISDKVTVTYVIKTDVALDNTELVAVVYAKAGKVYVDTELGSMIEVFTVQGQRIYSAEATAEVTSIDVNNADVVLVRVNGETIKVALK